MDVAEDKRQCKTDFGEAAGAFCVDWSNNGTNRREDKPQLPRRCGRIRNQSFPGKFPNSKQTCKTQSTGCSSLHCSDESDSGDGIASGRRMDLRSEMGRLSRTGSQIR